MHSKRGFYTAMFFVSLYSKQWPKEYEGFWIDDNSLFGGWLPKRGVKN
jgi:hypothetical protein